MVFLMKKPVSMVSLLLLFPVLQAALAADPVGRVIAIEGQATATGVDGAVRNIELKSDIFMNDKVVTPVGAKLQIRFNDDSVISQGEKSEMTIDQYVYNPKAKKEGSCSLKFAKGIFRTVTGKITELNPERFKVRTNMATIGIRGCELGFRLTENKEDVYVIGLPAGDSIIIEKILLDAEKGALVAAADRIISVVNEGVAVSIVPGAALIERPLTVSEGRQLIHDATPARSAGSSGSVSGDTSSSGNMKSSVDSATATRDQATVKEAMLNELSGTTVQGSSQSGKDHTFTQPTEPPYVPPPSTAPAALNGGVPGGSWTWGVWADGTVQYNADSSFGFEFLSSSDYSIISAVPSRTLTGTGDAGAAINGPGYSNTLVGKAMDGNGVTINVTIGSSVTPAWDATFKLTGSGGDSLRFDGAGSIDSGGALTLSSISGYTLTANSVTYGSGTFSAAPTLSGSFITPKPPLSPDIAGVAGSFRFQHTPGITVNGAFGADLF
jgi:hypothetical protein